MLAVPGAGAGKRGPVTPPGIQRRHGQSCGGSSQLPATLTTDCTQAKGRAQASMALSKLLFLLPLASPRPGVEGAGSSARLWRGTHGQAISTPRAAHGFLCHPEPHMPAQLRAQSPTQSHGAPGANTALPATLRWGAETWD